jgi:hypothetical protein
MSLGCHPSDRRHRRGSCYGNRARLVDMCAARLAYRHGLSDRYSAQSPSSPAARSTGLTAAGRSAGQVPWRSHERYANSRAFLKMERHCVEKHAGRPMMRQEERG